MDKIDIDTTETNGATALVRADGTLSSVVAQMSPEELSRRVKLAFKKMPPEAALAVFAKVMTAGLPHPLKVAVWDAVRYSHIWWRVDEVLKGPVLDDPIVQNAFADAVPIRRHVAMNQLPGWRDIRLTLYNDDTGIDDGHSMCMRSWLEAVIIFIVSLDDESAAYGVRIYSKRHVAERGPDAFSGFEDINGNNLLWYLTYRDDQQATGGFACPLTEKALLDAGVDPGHRNNLGLCWNDVRRHVNRSEF